MVAVVESMKMETSLVAPFRGRVRHVLAGPNVHVAAHAPLLQLEPIDGTAPRRGDGRADLVLGARATRRLRRSSAARTSTARMGGARLRRRRRRGRADRRPTCTASARTCWPATRRSSRVSTACSRSSRTCGRSPGRAGRRGGRGRAGAQPAGAPVCLLALARRAGRGPPGRATPTQLRRALRHYGVESLDRTPALEEACYRLFLAQQRAATAQGAVLAILDRRLEQAETLAGVATPDFREALDGLAAATDGRDPVVADLARQVRFALLRRAGDRRRARRGLRRSGRRPGRARGATPSAPTATRGWPPSSPARSRSLRRSPAAWRTRRRPLRACCWRRPRAASTACARSRRSPRRPSTATGSSPRATSTKGGPATSRRRSWTWPSCPVAPRRRSPRGPRAARRRAGRRGLLRPWTPPARPPSSPSGFARCSPASRCPERAPHRRRRYGTRARPGAVRDDVAHLPPERRRPGRGRAAARPAPDDVPPPAAGAAVGVRARAAARRRGRLPVPRRRAREPEGRAAVRAGRGARPHAAARRRRARRRAARARAHARAGARGDPPLPGPPQAEPPAPVEPHPAARLAADRPDAGGDPCARRSASPRRPPAWASRWCSSTAGCARPTGRERERVLRLFTPAGRGVVVEVDAPPTRAAAAARRGSAADRSPRAAADCCTRPRSSSCSPRPATKRPTPGQPAGAFIEHDLDDDGRLVPVDRPPATQPGRDRRRRCCATSPSATPRA